MSDDNAMIPPEDANFSQFQTESDSSRKAIIINLPEDGPVRVEPPPWALQQFFDGEINLEAELARRFENMPVVSNMKIRRLGENSDRAVATVATQDGSAHLVFDADEQSKSIRLTFTLGSMLSLRFDLDDLGTDNRQRWLELTRRDEGGLAFLWGEQRWKADYLIMVKHRYFTNLYAFSPNNFEAGVRLTPEVTTRLLDWLEKMWSAQPEDNSDDDDPPLLTW